MGAAKRG